MEMKMIGGHQNTSSRLGIAAVAGLLMGGIALTPADAADLGGDCCADLEERVAELEATSVRKGNRKVSLKLSGHVNRMLFWWDDGINTDVYSVDNTESETRFRLTGDASITPGLTAGFKIELEVDSAEGQNVDDRVDGAPNENSDGIITARKMEWNLKHDQLGELSVGRLSSASDDINQLNIAKNPLADADLDNFRDFHFVRPHGTLGCNGAACRTTLNLDAIALNVDSPRIDGVRYDSPSLFGLVISASWGEDDLADIAVRYKKEWNSIRVVAGIGYLWGTDETETSSSRLIDCLAPGLEQKTCIKDRTDFERIVSSASAMHVPTGLYVYGAANHDTFGNNHLKATTFPAPVTGFNVPDANSWYLQAGIKRRLLLPAIGATTLYGEFEQWNDYGIRRKSDSLGVDLDGGEITGSSVDMWGLGIVQDIDAAAMKLYAGLRVFESDIRVALPESDPEGQDIPLEDLLAIAIGGRIYF
jgi:predicted porin